MAGCWMGVAALWDLSLMLLQADQSRNERQMQWHRSGEGTEKIQFLSRAVNDWDGFFVAVQVCVCVLVRVCRLCVGKQEVIGSRIHHILLRSWLSPLSHVAPMPLSRDTESDILLPFPFFSPAISTRGSFCLLSLSSPLAVSSAAHHPLPLHTYKWVFLLHTYTKKTCVQVQLRLQVRIVQRPVRDRLLSILQTARALEALLRVPQCPIKQKDWRWRQRPHAKLFTTAPVTPRIVGFHLLLFTHQMPRFEKRVPSQSRSRSRWHLWILHTFSQFTVSSSLPLSRSLIALPASSRTRLQSPAW